MPTRTRQTDDQAELDDMPDPIPVPMQDGLRFPAVQIRFAGGEDHDAIEIQAALDELPLEAAFVLRVGGEVASKAWKISRDKDGVPTRTLVVTLKVDSIGLSEFLSTKHLVGK